MDLPSKIIQVLTPFEEAFSERVCQWSKMLLIGAILVPGERTGAVILRVMGLSNEKPFENSHRMLNRAEWSSRKISRLPVQVFAAPSGPLVFGIDETIERRRGRKIAARGIGRDAVRASKAFFVQIGRERWMSMMLLVRVPCAQPI